jgi:Flp pilus assembly protein TadG
LNSLSIGMELALNLKQIIISSPQEGKKAGIKAMKSKGNIGENWRLLGNESGVVIVIFALALIVLLAFMALSIDVGHVMVVRNELHNAADAASLAGANAFYPHTPTSTPTPPNWTAAETTASSAIQLNKSESATLVDCQVQSGYWNLSGTPSSLQPQSITPGALDVPAVMVTVSKAPGQNAGPIAAFFSTVLGINSFSVSAQSVAVSASPGSAQPGALFPIAISKELADQAASHNNSSKTVRIGSAYHYPNSMAGQWTSLNLNTNNVPTIRDLIAYGNPTPLDIGDNIWIQPGTKTTLYSSVPIGKTVLLAVVNTVLSDVTHSAVPIYGFIGFHITDSVGGSQKYVEGYFVFDYYAGLTGPGGPNYGVYSPPRLVK